MQTASLVGTSDWAPRWPGWPWQQPARHTHHCPTAMPAQQGVLCVVEVHKHKTAHATQPPEWRLRHRSSLSSGIGRWVAQPSRGCTMPLNDATTTQCCCSKNATRYVASGLMLGKEVQPKGTHNQHKHALHAVLALLAAY